jgi:uncharacterized protein (TIGR03086 family)
MTGSDLRPLHRRAVLASVEVVSRMTGEDLDRPTPCSEWTLAELLAHMTTQHYGFAAAAAGDGADLAVWQPRPPGDDPVAAYAAAADHVIAAFAQDGVPQRAFTLPEISTQMTFPGSTAIGFHLIDYVVHGWDVARSLGIGFELPPDLTQVALQLARTVPGGAARRRPGAAFKPGLPTPEGLDPLAETVALLGRSPTWPT